MTFSKRSFEVRSLRARGRGPENEDAQEHEKIGVRGSMGKCRDAYEDVKMWAKVDRKVLAQRKTGEVWLRKGGENEGQIRAGRMGGSVEVEGE